MRYFIVVVSLLCLISCGSGGGGGDGGGGTDLSCAPASPETPTIDLNTAELGQWTLRLTKTSSTCDAPPDSITCLLNMTVTGNDVAISGTCESNTGVALTLSNLQGIQSADTLYWGATMSATVDTYTETDTVPCNGVTFVSNSESETFNVTVSVSWSDGEHSDTCTTSFSGKFQ